MPGQSGRMPRARSSVVLNADARIYEADHSDVAADAILNTGLFDFEAAHAHPMWAKELVWFLPKHTPETEEYGVSSHVYRARRPFAPEKIMEVLNGELPGVIRAKGHFWIATRPRLGCGISRSRGHSHRSSHWARGGPLFPVIVGPTMMPRAAIWPRIGWSRGATDGRKWFFIGAGIDWAALKAHAGRLLASGASGAGAG